MRFEGDLLRKLEGISLVQRVINKAQLLGGCKESVHLLTDSEDVALVGKRNNVGVFCRDSISLENAGECQEFKQYLDWAETHGNLSVMLSPYAPLLTIETLEAAANIFLQSKAQVLQPVRIEKRRLFDNNYSTFANSYFNDKDEVHRIEWRGFMLLRPGYLLQLGKKPLTIYPWDAGDDLFEIETLQDWWVGEKLLRRKRIAFRVIGNNRVGLGHVYRALALAHELHDHEVLFVTDTHNQVAVDAIAKTGYWLGIFAPDDVVDEIIRLRPDMVISDVLNTNKRDIQRFRDSGSVTISFEDLGTGARYTDLTVNEIYDIPQHEANNVVWGRKYFFLRDEFQLAKPHRFRKSVSGIMLAFGGTDQHDLARKVYLTIRSLCKELKIHIHIVTGPGYRGYDRLMREIEGTNRVSLTHGSEVISSIMEQVEVAITSNGRTVYEFAHMNIPAIVVAQHKREVTHAFASEANGLVPLGIYRQGITESQISLKLKRLITDTAYRQKLFRRMTPHRFNKNKETVVDMVHELLDKN